MTAETGSSPDPLRRAARKAPDAPAIDAPGGGWSYAELDRAADRLAGTIRPLLAGAQGARGGAQEPRRPGPPVVAAFLPPTPEAVAALHGVPRTGAALAPLHPEWNLAELAAVLSRLAPAALLATEGRRETADAALARAGFGASVVHLAGAVPDDSTGAVRDDATEEAWDGGAAPVRNGRTGPAKDERASRAGPPVREIHTVLSTSGSSGRPRLVALSASNHLANARGVVARLGLGTGDRWLASLSFAHVGGLAIAIRAAVARSTLVLRGRFEAATWSRELEAAHITHVSLVPTMLRRLLEARGELPAPAPLVCALLGGAATDPGLLARALDRGWPVAITYGLTEAASQVATAEPARVRRKPGTVGPPLPEAELRIEDGEVQVRGAIVMAGYWDERAEPLEEGWLRTGDLGRLDDEGDLWILGRRSGRIVTGGVNVDPAEVEAVLLAHPGVRGAVVLGVPDPEWGERVVAAVEAGGAEAAGETGAGGAAPPAGGRDLIASLDRLCRERLSGPKRPKAFHLLAPMPRTPTGKPDRAAVRRLVGGPDG